MVESADIVHLNNEGILSVGRANVPLDELTASYNKGHSQAAILARFPSLTRAELHAAFDYASRQKSDETAPRPLPLRDTNWRQWNATIAEDTGTDTPPNAPISEHR